MKKFQTFGVSTPEESAATKRWPAARRQRASCFYKTTASCR